MRRKLIVLAYMLLVLVACNPIIPTAGVNPTNTAGYPAPQQPSGYNPGYPVATSTASISANGTPTEVTGTGFVTAKIYNDGTPLAQTTFFLANTLKNEQGQEIATSLDRATAPSAVSDADGVIRFYNVPPGRYGLILASGMNTYLLLYPDNGKAILFTIDTNSNFDLGELKFTDLPIN